jgi:hypothetical protein
MLLIWQVDDFPVKLCHKKYIHKAKLEISHYFVYEVYGRYSAEKCDQVQHPS